MLFTSFTPKQRVKYNPTTELLTVCDDIIYVPIQVYISIMNKHKFIKDEKGNIVNQNKINITQIVLNLCNRQERANYLYHNGFLDLYKLKKFRKRKGYRMNKLKSKLVSILFYVTCFLYLVFSVITIILIVGGKI